MCYLFGPIAQLVERSHGMGEVRSSSLLGSTCVFELGFGLTYFLLTIYIDDLVEAKLLVDD